MVPPFPEETVSERVRLALERVPRGELVPSEQRAHSREDRPLPIGYGQTISQPSLVALMTELLNVEPTDRILEIGTGSGYQAAILSQLAKEVFTVEVVEPLARRAEADLRRLGFAENVHFRIGDGYYGWPEEAPFDGIVVTAAPREVPTMLCEQLAEGARLVIPVGGEQQELRSFEKRGQSLIEKTILPVLFVPMTGRAEF